MSYIPFLTRYTVLQCGTTTLAVARYLLCNVINLLLLVGLSAMLHSKLLILLGRSLRRMSYGHLRRLGRLSFALTLFTLVYSVRMVERGEGN